MTASEKPVPAPDEQSAAYWEAAARGEFALPRCGVCRHFAMPPPVVCPTCGATEPNYQFEPVAGGGVIRSWTVVRDAFLPGWRDDVPYVLVDVELDVQTDLRCIGRLVDGPDVSLRLGQRVAIAFDEIADDVNVPAFELVAP
jgi:uncharacterized OB-fold protein